MTERELAVLLNEIAGAPVPCTPDGLARLEALADEHPGDVAVGHAALALHDALDALDAPAVVGGVRRDRLVRWDRYTVTWVGTDTTTTRTTLIRALRPAAARDPVLRRWFRRQVAALRPVVHARLVAEGEAAAVEVGGPMADPPRPSRPESVRWWVEALAAMEPWVCRDRGLPALALDELRATDDGIRIVCLTPGHRDVAPALASLARHLGPPTDDDPLSQLWAALQQAPPRTVEEAGDALLPALARTLAAERHHLRDRWQRGLHQRRASRLLEAVLRLSAAIPPPPGRGPVGVDLDGNITVVETRDGSVWWGPEGDMVPVFRPTDGFDAPLGRRLLRARAAAPPSPRLQEQTGGDLEQVEHLTRWVACGLRLRTIRLLLERAG